MVYKNSFVVAVKVNGKVLSEQGNVVKLPFGSEYTVLLKNMGNVKAVADVTVDGREVIRGIIVPENNSVELERFVDSMDSGYKLKFIEKTSDIERFRGNRIDDGILRVEYRFEKPEPIHDTWVYMEPIRFRRWGSDTSYTHPYNDVYLGSSCNTTPMASTLSAQSRFVQDKGITVEGNDSNQSFSYGSTSTLEETSHVITLQMKGYTEQYQQVQEPLYVRQKTQCKYCGFRWDNKLKFCGNCGSRLNT